MSEKYDLSEGGMNWFKKLLYGSPTEKIKELTYTDNYRSSDMLVELKINGVDMRVEDFNLVLKDWANNMEEQLVEKLDYIKTEEACKEKAREMFYNAINKLDWDE